MSEWAGLLTFDEQFVERIWGGRRLAARYGKALPPGKPIGESWIVSDHPSAESVVNRGPWAGRTLHALLGEDRRAILGTDVAPTLHGRFPLLLKIIDAADVLSVQVHPDDAMARALGEPDVGKTEMWHVLHAEPGSALVCGLRPGVTREQVAAMPGAGAASAGALLERLEVREGDSVFVPAGVVHALGEGLMIAEIQQNSDLTYRLYDWDRVQADGTPRALHMEKALQAIRFDARPPGLARPLALTDGPCRRTVLAACRYFAAELVESDGAGTSLGSGGRSFHIVLARDGAWEVGAGNGRCSLRPGEAVLVPGVMETFTVEGRGACLDYYVPDVSRDIAGPLAARGHSASVIRGLGTGW